MSEEKKKSNTQLINETIDEVNAKAKVMGCDITTNYNQFSATHGEIFLRAILMAAMEEGMKEIADWIISYGAALKAIPELSNYDGYLLALGLLSLINSASVGESDYDFDQVKDMTKILNDLIFEKTEK